MAHEPPERCLAGGGTAAAARLAVARTLAWALLLAGWLVLGALGRQYLPLRAGGLGAVAVWLVTVVIAQPVLQAHGSWLTAARLRGVLCTCGGVASVALVAMSGPRTPAAAWLLLAACAWGVLLLSASCCVRALRQSDPGRAPSPVSAAVAGALLAWAVAGNLAAGRQATGTVALGLLGAALGLAALVPRGGGVVSACRAGLFDCALHLPHPAAWRDPRQWPRHAATCAMLPMMASLPLMAEWCGTDPWARGSDSTVVALHLAAMLLPAWALGGGRERVSAAGPPAPWRPALQSVGVVLAMLLGGASLWAWPGQSGLMAASLWHAVGWSLAWALSMSARPVGRPADAGARAPSAGVAALLLSALFTGSAVWVLGHSTQAFGPQALVAVHAALAGVCAAGLAWPVRARRALPALP